jgi:cysteine synthase
VIDLAIEEGVRDRAAKRARERGIRLPTFAEMRDPSLLPDSERERLARVGLWDVDPANLLRITWRNEPAEKGGGFGNVNYIEFPSELTGVPARVIALVGRWFPTGCHKVGATYGCLAPRLVTGRFDPERDKAVWPSTGNYCRGGAYDAALLGCESIAILPEEMSRERFEWLERVAGEVIATPGCESNVKEIFDKTWELRETRDDVAIFNQFDEFGNYLWHYRVTGGAFEDALNSALGPRDEVAGLVLTTGSAGTIASGDYLKTRFPGMRVAAGEALQCPTLAENGFGGHRIEGIGDKHVPWIHNVRNTDAVVTVDDAAVTALARLFNETAGRKHLLAGGVPQGTVEQLGLLGFSGIANLLMAARFAKHYELGERDVILTVLTDSMDLYASRLAEMHSALGEYTETDASADRARWLLGGCGAELCELSHAGRRRVHNLKYFTWVEQQRKSVEELKSQWSDRDYWRNLPAQVEEIDALITEFNALAAG